MTRKHHAVYSDPTGAAAAAAKRRPSRTKDSESSTPQISSAVAAPDTLAQLAPIDHAAVARLAYSYWESRGFAGGSAEEDWLRAERELNQGVIA